jgi:uncharacterized membrane protein
MSSTSRYAKALVAIAGLVAQAIAAYTTDTQHAQDISQIVIAVLTALGVYGVPNNPPVTPTVGDNTARGL